MTARFHVLSARLRMVYMALVAPHVLMLEFRDLPGALPECSVAVTRFRLQPTHLQIGVAVVQRAAAQLADEQLAAQVRDEVEFLCAEAERPVY